MFHIHFVTLYILYHEIVLLSVLVYYVAISSACEIKIHYSLFVAVASLNPVVEEHKPPQILDTNKGTYICIRKLLCIQRWTIIQ